MAGPLFWPCCLPIEVPLTRPPGRTVTLKAYSTTILSSPAESWRSALFRQAAAAPGRPGCHMLITVADGRGRVREAVCGELGRSVRRAVAWPGGVADDRVGDFGQDIGVVGEAEPFGHPHDLVGGVRRQDAGDLGEFGVRDGAHLLINRGQFPVAGNLPDRLGTPAGKQAG